MNPLLGEATIIGFPAIERTYEKNQLIYTMGAPAKGLYVIVSGRVKVSVLSEQGREKILYLLSKGEVFGELFLISQ